MDLRGKIAYPHVASTLALVLALGGGVVYAADKIGSADIERDAIKAKHIKDGQVKGPEVDEGSLSTGAVRPRGDLRADRRLSGDR